MEDGFHGGFEWDEEKRLTALKKHGIDFDDVVGVFKNNVVTTLSMHDDEQRWIAIGLLNGTESMGPKSPSFTPCAVTHAESSPRGERDAMKEKNITRVTLEEARKLKGHTDWDRLRSMTEEDIERAIADDPDWEGTDDIDWSKAVMMPPQIKKAVSIRLDQDVLDFFKAAGRGYQTRINTILRSYMEARKSR